MKRIVALFIVVFSVVLSPAVLRAADRPVKVFLLLGQSNMNGRGNRPPMPQAGGNNYKPE